MDMHTDLTVVPHASLRNPNPERSRKVLKSMGVFKRKRGQKLKAGPIRQGDVVACKSAELTSPLQKFKSSKKAGTTEWPTPISPDQMGVFVGSGPK